MRYTKVILFIVILTVLPSIVEADEDDFSSVDTEWKALESRTSTEYESLEKRETQLWRKHQERIKQKWKDGAVSEQKIYVEYFQDNTSRIQINYETATVTVEALSDKSEAKEKTKQRLHSALVSVVKNGLISKEEVPPEAEENAEITSEVTVAEDKSPRTLYQISFNLIPDFVMKRAQKLKPIVDEWTTRYQLQPAFVLAVIRQESSFNPRARSWVPAFGLMQVVPKYAGQEVLKAVTGKIIIPDSDFLYEPTKNIMVGTTYLKILRDVYFSDVKDEAKRMYMMMASYNWGPHRIQTLIKKGRLPASASSAETFDIIQRYAPTETRNYVKKISQYFIEFKKAGL